VALEVVVALGGEACVGEKLLCAQAIAPCRDAHRDAQRPALSFGFDLDGVKSCEGAPRDDLAALLVSAGQEHQQLALRSVADTVKTAQLAADRVGEIGKRLGGQGVVAG
jgi:hypothetical protein